MFTSRRDGRRSLPLRANVRVGPPAMSSSVRSFLRLHFCGSIYRDTMKTEIALAPKTSQRPTEGAFFSSESAEKNRTGWAAKACLNRSARKPILPDGRPKRVFNEPHESQYFRAKQHEIILATTAFAASCPATRATHLPCPYTHESRAAAA